MTHAPIALFVYKRPRHTQRTVEALTNNGGAADSELIVFSDSPAREEDLPPVRAVRDYCRTIRGFKKVSLVERDEHLGLARSLISGVTEIVERAGRVIVLEDDILTSPHFLRYLNDALDFYHDDERVISIHSYNYPAAGRFPETFFLRGADCWGWATWKRGWDLFDPDGAKLLAALRAQNLTRRFDFNGCREFTRMLENQVAGANDSWAIRWHASAYLLGKLTLYPGRSLVRNIGIDESGTHCQTTDVYDTEPAQKPVLVEQIPVREDEEAFQSIARYFCSTKPSLRARLAHFLRKRVAHGT